MKTSKSYQHQVEKLNRDILHHMSNFLRNSFEDWQLTEIQYLTLTYIHEHPSCTIGACASAVHQDAGNMSSLCKRMESDGFILRKKRKGDERIVELSLTTKGSTCIEDILQRVEMYYDKEWNRYDDKDKDLILTGLTKLNQFFEKLKEQQRKAGTSK